MQALEEMEQLETINQDITDEQQTESKVNDMVGVHIANLIQTMEKTQDHNLINETIIYKPVINDEEEEYIKSNNIHLDKQLDIQQQQQQDDNVVNITEQFINRLKNKQNEQMINKQS